MSDDSKKRDDEELEALLRRLQPSPLEADQLASIQGVWEKLREDEGGVIPSRRTRIVRFAVMSIVFMGISYFFVTYRYGAVDRVTSQPQYVSTGSGDTLASTPGDPVEEPGSLSLQADPAMSRPDGQRLLPVSSHGSVVNTSAEGIIKTEEGPKQRLRIDYRDAYHWHDSETGTNIRYFEPRTEELIVPLLTD